MKTTCFTHPYRVTWAQVRGGYRGRLIEKSFETEEKAKAAAVAKAGFRMSIMKFDGDRYAPVKPN